MLVVETVPDSLIFSILLVDMVNISSAVGTATASTALYKMTVMATIIEYRIVRKVKEEEGGD